MPDAPALPNDPAARAPDGTIIEPAQQTKPTTPDPTTTSTPTPEPAKATEPAKADAKADAPKSLLNEGDKKDGDKPALVGAPEAYTDFTAPEGYEFAKETLEGAHTLFKSLNLSQAGAQELVNFHAAELAKAGEAPMKLWQDTQEEWRTAIKSDPEIGGKLDQVKADVSRLIDGIGDPKLAADYKAAMDLTGAGNNPAFVKFMYKLAQKFGEGKSVPGGGPSKHGQTAPGAAPTSAARALYPNLPSQGA
jgi:hypothetical protein